MSVLLHDALVHSAALRLHVVRLSVRLSVTLVDQDHKGWKSWKLSVRTISPSSSSLFVAQKPSTYSQGNMGKLGETRRGVGKSGVLEHKSGNVSETRKDIEEKLLWRAYRKSQTFFRTVQSPTPYSLPFHKSGVRNPTPKLQSLLSQERLQLYADCKFGRYIHRSIQIQAHEKKIGEMGAWAHPGTAPIF